MLVMALHFSGSNIIEIKLLKDSAYFHMLFRATLYAYAELSNVYAVV